MMNQMRCVLAAYATLALSLGCSTCGNDVPPRAGATVDARSHADAYSLPAPEVDPDKGCGCPENQFCSSGNTCVPLAWFCSPSSYQGGHADGCDCNCGSHDPDCDRADAAHWCYVAGRVRRAATCDACAGMRFGDPEE